jgi:HSP20 family protein
MKMLKVHGAKSKGRVEESLPDLRVPVIGGFRGTPAWAKTQAMRTPAIDISENDEEMTVTAEIPGLSEKDLDLSYLDGVLYLKGEKKEEKETRGKNTWHRETWQGSFTRGIPVGRQVDWKKAQARYKDGVLNVTLPKTHTGEEKRVKIDIQ